MTISTVPVFPPLGSATYNVDAYNWAVHIAGTFRTEFNADLATIGGNAVTATAAAAAALVSQTAAAASATIALGAVATSGAVLWVSGTTYAIGNVVYSPLNLANYRRKTAGAGATDPSLDATNWAKTIAVDNGLVNIQTLVTNLVLTAASPQYQKLSASAGLDVVLPDATTLTTGFNVFKVNNSGIVNGIGIVDGAGAMLGYTHTTEVLNLNLIGNTSTGGVWEQDIGNTASFDVADVVATQGTSGTTGIASSFSKFRTAQLTASLALTVYVTTANTTNCVATNLTTGAMGSPVQASAGATSSGTACAVFPLTATTALVVFDNLKMVVATVTGTVVTYGAIVTLVYSYGLFASSASGGVPNICKLSATSFLTLGGWSGQPQVTCITIAGTVITQVSVANSAIAESWSGDTSWVPLTATTALCAHTGAVGNTAPYTSYAFVVSVSAGTPSFGTAISRAVGGNTTAQPLLPQSATKALQVINQGASVYARVLTVSGTTVTAGAELTVRADVAEGATSTYSHFSSPTHADALALSYAGITRDRAHYPMGGNYYLSHTKAGTLDVLTANFSTNTVTAATQAVAGTAFCLTDANYLLASAFATPNLTINRFSLSASGLSVQSDTVITDKNGATASFVPGKTHIGLIVGATGAGKTVFLTTAGVLRASVYSPSSQSPCAFAIPSSMTATYQYLIGTRAWTWILTSTGQVQSVRLL